jgi:hypothetical protein
MSFLTLSERKHLRDEIAAAMSLIPGLGHAYKGYYAHAMGILFLTPAILFASALLGLATFGLGLLMPFVFWMGIGIQAYYLPDHRKFHPLI